MKQVKNIPILVLSFIFFFLYSFVSLIKHWHFLTGLDLAIYNQTLWFYSHLQWPYVTLYPTFGRLVWADHFTPTLIFLTPIYALFPRAETLLIIQAFFFTSGAIPLYLIAKEKTKSLFFSLSAALAYLLFFGSQFALTFDFHAATFGASFLPWIFYFLETPFGVERKVGHSQRFVDGCRFLEKSKWKIFFLLAVLALGAKEDMAIVVLSLGIFMLFKSGWRRMGFVTLVIAITYFATVIFAIIPALSQGLVKEYISPNWTSDLITPTKLKTVFLSFASFGFLPLLSPTTWIFSLTHFAYNFLGPSGRGDIYLHYRVALAPLLTYASIYGVLNLKKYLPSKPAFKFGGGILLIAIFTLQYFLHLPLNTLSKKDFYEEKDWMRDNKKLIKMVPNGASVSTQNHLAPYLSGRQRLYYFPAKEDYLLLDLRTEQNPLDFWASPPPEESKKIIEGLIEKGEYQEVETSGKSILLKRSLSSK